jgi:hypothetical protein
MDRGGGAAAVVRHVALVSSAILKMHYDICEVAILHFVFATQIAKNMSF